MLNYKRGLANRLETSADDIRNRITCVRFRLMQELQIDHRPPVQTGTQARVRLVTSSVASHEQENSLLELSFLLQSIGPRCRSCHFDLNCKQRSVRRETTKDLSLFRVRTSVARVCVAPWSVDLNATNVAPERNHRSRVPKP